MNGLILIRKDPLNLIHHQPSVDMKRLFVKADIFHIFDTLQTFNKLIKFHIIQAQPKNNSIIYTPTLLTFSDRHQI